MPTGYKRISNIYARDARRNNRDVANPLQFNEYSANDYRMNHHLDNIDALREKFILMNQAKPIFVRGKKRTFTVNSINNPYKNISDYYINTSQRQNIRDKKNKISLTKRIPITYIRYDSRGRSGMRKPSKPKTTYKKHTPSKQRPRRQTTPRKQRPKK